MPLRLNMTNLTRDDFRDVLEDIGEKIQLERSAKSTGAITGSETLSYAAPIFIKAIFQLNQNTFIQGGEGQITTGDAVVYGRQEDAIVKNDKITHKNVAYLVKDKTTRFSIDLCNLFRWSPK